MRIVTLLATLACALYVQIAQVAQAAPPSPPASAPTNPSSKAVDCGPTTPPVRKPLPKKAPPKKSPPKEKKEEKNLCKEPCKDSCKEPCKDSCEEPEVPLYVFSGSYSYAGCYSDCYTQVSRRVDVVAEFEWQYRKIQGKKKGVLVLVVGPNDFIDQVSYDPMRVRYLGKDEMLQYQDALVRLIQSQTPKNVEVVLLAQKGFDGNAGSEWRPSAEMRDFHQAAEVAARITGVKLCSTESTLEVLTPQSQTPLRIIQKCLKGEGGERGEKKKEDPPSQV